MIDKVYNVNESFKNIEILVKVTNIEICKSDTSDIKIVTTKREGSNYSVLVDEDTLKIRDCRKKWYMYLLPCFKSQKISINVPRDMLENIKIKTVTGKIKITDILCDLIEVQNVTGKIELEKVVAKNKINIKNNTGRVYFNEVDSNDICIKSNTGSVRGILLSEKAFIVKSKTGKINIPNSFGTSRCQIISNTGNINFEIKDKNQ